MQLVSANPAAFFSMASALGDTLQANDELALKRKQEADAQKASLGMLGAMVGAQQQPMATLGNLGAGVGAPPAPVLGAASPTAAGTTFPMAVGKDAFQPARGAGTGYGALNTVYQGALDKAAPDMPSPTTMYSYLRSQGASPNEAMLLTGAAASESGFNFRATHDGGTGYGLFGHRLDRLDRMRQFAGTATPSWQQQAAFGIQELRSRPEAALVASARSPQDLAIAQMHFEQPQGYTRANPMAGHNFNGRLNTISRFSQAFGGGAAPSQQPVQLAQAGASDAPLPVPAGQFLAQRQAAKDGESSDAAAPGVLAQVAPPPQTGLSPAMSASPTARALVSQGVTPAQLAGLQAMIANPLTRAQGWQLATGILKKEDPITQQKNLLELEKLTREVRGPGYALDMQGKALANQAAAQKLGERNITSVYDADGNEQKGYWDGGSFKIIGGAKKDAGTTDEQNYEAYKKDQQSRGQPALSFNEWGQQWRKAGANNVNTTISGEKAYDAEVGKANAKDFGEIQTAGRSAVGQLSTYRIMQKLVDSPNFYSGAGSASRDMLNRAAISLGIADAGKMAPNELFGKLANKAILEGLGGSLGAGVSNADRDFIQGTVANRANTPEGNRAILDYSVKLAQRQIDMAKMARDYAAKSGGRLDAGFNDELTKFAEANPLVSDADRKASGAAQPVAKAPAPGARQAPDGNWYVADPSRPGKFLMVR